MIMAPKMGRNVSAFTLIEIIGVLAIVAILASLLVPRVFETIDNARLGAVPLGVHTIKTATLEHFVKFNSIASRNGTPLAFSGTYDDFDLVLLTEGLIDKPFMTRVGTNATIRLVDVAGLNASSAPLDESRPGAYDLDGDGDNDIVGAKYLIEAVIDEPARVEVAGVNTLLDGPMLGFQGAQDNDIRGRVVFRDKSNDPNPNANPQGRKRRPGTMYIYITHQ